jgi:acetylglutamate kinase
MEPLYVIKIGGNIIDDTASLKVFLQEFTAVKGHKILVHGGGKLATQLAGDLNIPQQLIDGRRITDADSLKVVTMVYAGFINKNIVAQLQALGCNAVGISGADGNAILAYKRKHTTIDYGFVGDVDAVNSSFLTALLQDDRTVVIAPITHDGSGQLLNTNADTIAQEVAKAMSSHFDVQLIYSFEKPGVLLDAADDSTVITSLNPLYYQQLKEEKKIFAGMIPKLDNAFAALESGVKKVIIGKAENLQQLLNGHSGTTIIND